MNNKYLLLLQEINATTKLAKQGKISRSQAQDLEKRGLIRSKDQYMKGIDTGYQNILRKNKIPEIKTSAADISGGFGTIFPAASKYGSDKINKMIKPAVVGALGKKYSNPIPKSNFNKSGSNVILSPDKTRFDTFSNAIGVNRNVKIKPNQFKDSEPILKRHEADEAVLSSKGKDPSNKIFYSGSDWMPDVKGMHISPKVLKREKDIYDVTHPLYGVGKQLKSVRQQSGETNYAKMKPTQIRRVNSASEKQSESPDPSMPDVKIAPIKMANPENKNKRHFISPEGPSENQYKSAKSLLLNLTKKYKSRGMNYKDIADKLSRTVNAQRAMSIIRRFEKNK